MRRLIAMALMLAVTSACGGGEPPAPPRAQSGTISEVTGQPAPAEPAIPAAAPPATPPPQAADHQPAPQSRVVRITPAPTTVESPAARHDVVPPTPQRSETTVRRDAARVDNPSTQIARIPEPGRDTAAPATTVTSTRYSGPSTGTIRWSGILDRDGTLTLDADRPSTGSMTGALPGVPVLLQLVSKEFTIVEPPSAGTNWKRLTLRSRSVQSSLILQWTVIP
jgi:hypothetical protein